MTITNAMAQEILLKLGVLLGFQKMTKAEGQHGTARLIEALRQVKEEDIRRILRSKTDFACIR